MVYLERFRLPTPEEEDLANGTGYPFHLFMTGVPILEFEPITILYGGNGSGKTTILNLIAQVLKLKRSGDFNRSGSWSSYQNLCCAELAGQRLGYPVELPSCSRYIASDDVFSEILNMRRINEQRRGTMAREFGRWRQAVQSMRLDTQKQNGYDSFLEHRKARQFGRNAFARMNGAEEELRQFSNGENAIQFFMKSVEESGLYLLDEPENSLAPPRQCQLADYIQSSTTLGAQFIIATHSPLLLGLENARVYDLDGDPICIRPWYQLENVRLMHEFFEYHRSVFLDGAER